MEGVHVFRSDSRKLETPPDCLVNKLEAPFTRPALVARLARDKAAMTEAI